MRIDEIALKSLSQCTMMSCPTYYQVSNLLALLVMFHPHSNIYISTFYEHFNS
jgi:hypothetical protein